MTAVDVAIGIDLGTSGAKALAVDLHGHVLATGRCPLPRAATRTSGCRVEQDPASWTAATSLALRGLAADLPRECRFLGVAVDATSGTFLVTDPAHRPLTAGIMYNDLRGADQAERAANAVQATLAPYGIRIAPSFALAKLAHLAHDQPALLAHGRVVHQTDWIVGQLCGRYDVTDISTALKTGADPGTLTWPAALEPLGIPLDCLPQIVLPGTEIGRLTRVAAAETGLPAGTPIVAGCTDGTAGCLASGASRPGDLNVTLGSTLVFKGVAEQPLVDPVGAVYNHRHPAGGFLPGAASSTGAEWIGAALPGADLDALSRAARALLPTADIVYPLVKQGERFPFSCATAVGFGLEQIADPAARLAAGMEGVALIERLGIARLEQLGWQAGPQVLATGGGTANDLWLAIRAAVNRRAYVVPRVPECALGAAVLATAPQLGGCWAAIAALVRYDRQVDPDRDWAARYDDNFAQLCEALEQRGYR